MQQTILISNLLTTLALALMIMVVARHEIGYVWWKALVIAFIGLGTGWVAGAGIGAIQASGKVTMGLSITGIFIVAAAVAFASRNLLRMTWRDAVVIGLVYVFAQTLVPFLVIRFS